jgi:hypothetical protein
LGGRITRCPRDNLRALKILRGDVEHKLLGRADAKWLGLFQACCLNFDKAICDLFGSRSTLSHELSFAIQFTEMNLEQRYQITGVFPVRPADFGGRKAKPPISRVF